MIHRIGEDNYPDIVNHNGISSWFTLEPFDFYHKGIKFILNIETGVIENCEGYPGNLHWAIIPFSADFDRAAFRRINIWKLGLIPYRNIRIYDPKGDEYYNVPHLHCDFNVNSMPYEGFEYAIVANNGEYFDYPLNPARQLTTEAVIIPTTNKKTQMTSG